MAYVCFEQLWRQLTTFDPPVSGIGVTVGGGSNNPSGVGFCTRRRGAHSGERGGVGVGELKPLPLAWYGKGRGSFTKRLCLRDFGTHLIIKPVVFCTITDVLNLLEHTPLCTHIMTATFQS